MYITSLLTLSEITAFFFYVFRKNVHFLSWAVCRFCRYCLHVFMWSLTDQLCTTTDLAALTPTFSQNHLRPRPPVFKITPLKTRMFTQIMPVRWPTFLTENCKDNFAFLSSLGERSVETKYCWNAFVLAHIFFPTCVVFFKKTGELYWMWSIFILSLFALQLKSEYCVQCF